MKKTETGRMITLVGLGCGSVGTMTMEAVEALENADVLIGAGRLLESISSEYGVIRYAAINANEICEIILREKNKNVCILYSGDTGFYSGTRRLLPLLKECGVKARVIPGISSVQLLSARLGRPWQDWNLFSAHGTYCNAVNAVMQGKPAYFLTGGKLGPAELCRQLCDAGLGTLKVTIGEDLSYEKERVREYTAAEAAKKSFEPLAVMLVEQAANHVSDGSSMRAAMPVKRTPGIPDEAFIRGDVPMTKQVVRAAVLAKLAVKPDDVIWDVGAGTGSVSVEMALAAGEGQVYAIECVEEGCCLIEKNRREFGAWNLSIIKGKAPEVLAGLPIPDAVFIGGTRGQMKEIVSLIHEKNKNVRICISAIALETLHEAMEALVSCGYDAGVTQISVSNTKKAGTLNLLTANNPIFLITN